MNFAFSKLNYILLAVGFAIIVLGFILMTGGSTTEEAFNPDIFSTRRIVVGPMISLFGFIFTIFAILYKRPAKQEEQAGGSLDTTATSATGETL
jgi:uncharacterized membrane protein